MRQTLDEVMGGWECGKVTQDSGPFMSQEKRWKRDDGSHSETRGRTVTTGNGLPADR